MAVADYEPHFHGVGSVGGFAVEGVGCGGLLDAVDIPAARHIAFGADVAGFEAQVLRRQLCGRHVHLCRRAREGVEGYLCACRAHGAVAIVGEQRVGGCRCGRYGEGGAVALAVELCVVGVGGPEQPGYRRVRHEAVAQGVAMVYSVHAELRHLEACQPYGQHAVAAAYRLQRVGIDAALGVDVASEEVE